MIGWQSWRGSSWRDGVTLLMLMEEKVSDKIETCVETKDYSQKQKRSTWRQKTWARQANVLHCRIVSVLVSDMNKGPEQLPSGSYSETVFVNWFLTYLVNDAVSVMNHFLNVLTFLCLVMFLSGFWSVLVYSFWHLLNPTLDLFPLWCGI